MEVKMLERKEADFFIGKNNGEGNKIRSPQKGKFAPATSPAFIRNRLGKFVKGGKMRPIKSVYGDCKEIKWTKKFKAGYILQREFVQIGTDSGVWMTVAYNHNGDYIGNPRDAYRLCVKRGILPEKAESKHTVCSIGYCKKKHKWYGWSHRAIYGFGIGYIAKKGSCPTESGFIDGYLEEHPEEDRRVPVGFRVKNLIDAKRVAVAMAESVS